MTKPRAQYAPDDIPALLAELDPDNAAVRAAAADAETRQTLAQAARFVANRAGRWAHCAHRTCRKAGACRGVGPPEAPPPCATPSDRERIGDLALFAALERLRLSLDGLEAGAEAPPSGDRGEAPF